MSEGAESVTLSLAAAFWLARAWLVGMIAAGTALLSQDSSVGAAAVKVLLAVCGLMVLVGFSRLYRAARARSRHRIMLSER